MNISVKTFTDMAAQAARQKGYLDIETVAVQDATGQTVQQEKLVLKGTGFLARLKRHFGVRPEGADQRVHNAFVAALKAEAGISSLEKLAPADREVIESAQTPSARRRIEAAARLATNLVERGRAVEQTHTQSVNLFNHLVISGFPDNEDFQRAVSSAHDELHAEAPNEFPADKVYLRTSELRDFPAAESDRAPLATDLQLVKGIRSAVNAEVKRRCANAAELPSPLSAEEVKRIVVDKVKAWIVQGKPLHDTLERVGLPVLPGNPEGSRRLMDAACKLIAARDQVSLDPTGTTFQADLSGAPTCAEHLLKMASGNSAEAREALLEFASQIAQGRTRGIVPSLGTPTFCTGASALVQTSLALSIAKERGLDIDQLRANLLEAPEALTLLKGAVHFRTLNQTHGSVAAAVAGSVGAYLRDLLLELDRNSQGVVVQGPGAFLNQPIADFDPEVDGETVRRLGFDLEVGEKEFRASNVSTIKRLLDNEVFRADAQRRLIERMGQEARLETVLEGLKSYLKDRVEDDCSVRGVVGELDLMRSATEDEVHAAAIDYLDALTGSKSLRPVGAAAVLSFTLPDLRLEHEGAQRGVPFAGFYAAGGAMREAIGNALQQDVNQAAGEGVLQGDQDRRLNDFTRDLARGLVEIHHPKDGSLVRPRKSPNDSAESARSQLLRQFESGLRELVPDEAALENAKRDLASGIGHQGLIGSVLIALQRELNETTLAFTPNSAMQAPFVIAADPEQPGALRVTWNQVSTDLDQVYLNGALLRANPGEDGRGAQLPIRACANVAVRYTPSLEAGQPGKVTVLQYDKSIHFNGPARHLIIDGISEQGVRLNDLGQLV